MKLQFNASDVRPEYGNRDARKESAPVHHGDDASRFSGPSSDAPCGQVEMPAGFDLYSSLVEYFYQSAPKPNRGVAIAATYTFLSTIFGRSYQTPTKAGCAQITALIAVTGSGKEWGSAGIIHLLNHIAEMPGGNPNAKRFIGKKVVSGPGFVKEIAKNPVAFWRINEGANLLASFGDPRAAMHLKQLGDTILDVSSKGGAEGVLDPYAYSDTDKNGEPVYRPAPTMLFEGTPEGILATLTPETIASGLWPRLSPFIGDGQRSYYNEARKIDPPNWLAQTLANVTGICFSLSQSNRAVVVQWDAEAQNAMRGFDREVTDRMNAGGSEAENELWNRAHLKALKYATLHAVARNWNAPLMNLADAHKGIELARSQVELLLAKFHAGETGQQAGNETVQERELIKVINDYTSKSWDEVEQYDGKREMHRDGVITHSHIQQRLYRRTAFKQDRRGAKSAIAETVKSLIDADILREIPKSQMALTYNSAPKAYSVANADEFLKRAKRGF